MINEFKIANIIDIAKGASLSYYFALIAVRI